MLKTIRSLIFALGAAVAPLALATSYPAPVKFMTEHGVKVLRQFPAPSGLTGYIGEVRGQPFAFYVTADGKSLLIGRLFDAKGRNITAVDLKKYAPKPDLQSAWQKLEKAAWFAEGASHPKTIIYEFSDPNCPYCHLFWLANQPYFKAGLQVRHLLVAFLAPSSRTKAAAILMAKDPAAAYAENERKYRMDVPEAEAGGIAPAKRVPDSIAKKLKANAKLMVALGITGTPGVVYRDAKGKVHTISGLPRLSMLPGMYRLPAQPETNPLLKGYE